MSALIYFIIMKTDEYWFQDRTLSSGELFAWQYQRAVSGYLEAHKGMSVPSGFRGALAMEHPGTHRQPAPCRRCYKLMEQWTTTRTDVLHSTDSLSNITR